MVPSVLTGGLQNLETLPSFVTHPIAYICPESARGATHPGEVCGTTESGRFNVARGRGSGKHVLSSYSECGTRDCRDFKGDRMARGARKWSILETTHLVPRSRLIMCRGKSIALVFHSKTPEYRELLEQKEIA